MSEIQPGVYEALVTEELREKLARLDPKLVRLEELSTFDVEEMLVRYLAALARRAIKIAAETDSDLAGQALVVNQIAAAMNTVVEGAVTDADLLSGDPQVLLDIASGSLPDGSVRFPARPEIALSASALLVNGREQPQIGHEVAKELQTADRVDLLCAFVKWRGLRLIEADLAAFIGRGGQLRVITTTYMGATDAAAIKRLRELGAEIAVSFDTRRTRLHAKAWLFRRSSTLDTAYVGSSNLSQQAMLDGLEWNVKLARAEQPQLLDTFAATFEEYWNDPSFEPYEIDRDHERLKAALRTEQAGQVPELAITNIDVEPYPYQREILEALQAAREVHGHHRNLAVMATGTGKTIVAALDYARLKKLGRVKSLLFVAHRKEILEQSLATFRVILKDGSFGELLVDGKKPTVWQHVFASVQSLAYLSDLDAERFDMVIVDEFHHAAAATYARLLDHVKPKELLALTATPERPDGQDILHWFDGRKPTVELRLWEALERGLLVPFHYFGIHDNIDLSKVAWKRGSGYDATMLTELYTDHQDRVNLIVQALRNKLSNVSAMKAVGFCVSIDHANFMAEAFVERGIPSRAITSQLSTEEREEALRQLRAGELQAVFTVDLFNEGVDVPDIDTVLFLRPTESATVFLQQLGRGLRLTKEKPVLTVLDFVGNQHKEFRFDRRFSALTGIIRSQLPEALNAGFPTLPAGCSIDLDREVSRIVLDNLKRSLGFNIKEVTAEIRQLGRVPLRTFLQETGYELEDLYDKNRGGWTRMLREAGVETREVTADDQKLGRAFGRMLHVDDPLRLQFLDQLLSRTEPPQPARLSAVERRMLEMLHAMIDGNVSRAQLDVTFQRLWENPARKEELHEVVGLLQERVHRVTPPVEVVSHLPLRLHASYTKDELLAAFGRDKPRSMVSGVYRFEEESADVFMVTIDKSGGGFKPSTMYNDRAISPRRFQWESQLTTTEASSTGQRYINHDQMGWSIHLFIRHTKTGSAPYLYGGPMHYQSHEGQRPMKILWELEHDLPADVFHYAKVTSG